MNDQPEQRQHRLAKKLSFRTQTEGDESAVVLYDVPLLTEGKWHDSLAPYPTIYTPENLSKFTTQGAILGYKSHNFDHTMDDEIGEAINIRYDPDTRAIMADLLFHQETQASRDTLAMIRRRFKQNRPAYVSIEMFTRDVPTEAGMEAQDILVTGWIATAEPACKRCAIPKQQAEHKDMTDEKEKQKQQTETDPEDEKQKEPETAGTADAPQDPEDEKKPESEKQQECGPEDKDKKEASEGDDNEDDTDKEEEEELKKLSARIAELEKQVHALNEAKTVAEDNARRIKALEQAPGGRVTLNHTGSAAEPAVEPFAEYHSKPNY